MRIEPGEAHSIRSDDRILWLARWTGRKSNRGQSLLIVEEATRIVRVLIERKHLAGVQVQTETALAWFSEAGLDEEKSMLGVVRACLNGWIISRKDGTIELTETALAAARRLAH